jgi:hypothetical protein
VAIVSVPVRDDVLVLAATLNVVVPLPLPLAPPVTVIQALLLWADHVQPAATVTDALPVPPDAATD